MGRRERPDPRCRQAPHGHPGGGARLRLRAPADGGGRDPAAIDARRPGKAGLLRQVHDNRRAPMTAETETASIPQQRSGPQPVFTDAEAGAKESPDSNNRRFTYYHPAKRKQSHYEDVTVEVQP